MKKFKINIKEILEREVEIIADTEEEAIEIVFKQYKNEEIILDDSDYSGNPVIKKV